MKPAIAIMALLLVLPAAVDAQMRGRGRMAAENSNGTETRAGMVERREASITATGLTPRFPAGLVCAPISSPYGSPNRYDGSRRRNDRNGGLHGGLDITLNAGTPLLAIADGEVIAKGEGGQLEGIFLWLRIAPADSGQPFWTFAKYQHLAVIPTLGVGARVKVGQVVAISGGSGTAGGHYGAAGYPHLHLSTNYGPSPQFEMLGMFASMARAEGAQSGDPMTLYLRHITGPDVALALPESTRVIDVPVVGPDGTIQPADSQTVWPVACSQS